MISITEADSVFLVVEDNSLRKIIFKSLTL